MALAVRAARVWGRRRGWGQAGLVLLQRLGVRGLAVSVSTWGTRELSPAENRDVNAIFRVWGSCKE